MTVDDETTAPLRARERIILELDAEEAQQLGRALTYADSWITERIGELDPEIATMAALKRKILAALFGPTEEP